MLIHLDVKNLEVVGAAYLSQDKILGEAIRTGIDIHEFNQKALNLPSRLIAKVFVFRLIYGGSAYSYVKDLDFRDVSTSQAFWQEVIDKFYSKYKGLAAWHIKLVQEAVRTGKLVMPTGREYAFDRVELANNLIWWRPKILNYPVQGLGADLVAIGRVTTRKRLIKEGLYKDIKMQSTVHDSIDIDSPTELVDKVSSVMYNSITDIPLNFKRLFGVDFNLPLSAEVFSGPNLKDLTKLNYGSN